MSSNHNVKIVIQCLPFVEATLSQSNIIIDLPTTPYLPSTMASYTGNGKLFSVKQKDYLERKKEKKRNRAKYLQRKVKQGKATKKEKEELKVLENKS